jgi:GNAT superfamily N-acetyltransferase
VIRDDGPLGDGRILVGVGLALGVATLATRTLVASGSLVRVGPRLKPKPEPELTSLKLAIEESASRILQLHEKLVTSRGVLDDYAGQWGLTESEAQERVVETRRIENEIRTILSRQAEAIRLRDGLERFDISAVLLDRDPPLRLDFFVVGKGDRKQGRGTRAMQDLTRFADALGWKTILSPEPIPRQGTTSRDRLVRFYKRFGFVENRDRNKDFRFMEGMWREPLLWRYHRGFPLGPPAKGSPARVEGSSARAEGSSARSDRRKEKKEHDAIVALARKIRAEKYTSCPAQGACFWHALAVIEAAKRHGRRLVLQAGSASWRRVPERLDDGVSATHFSYVWEPDSPLTRAIIARFFAGDTRMLPEMHVWAGDPATQELVDITTRYWPEQCKSLTGEDWLGPLPPDYLWTTARDLPDDAVYEPDMRATMLAGKIAMLQGWKP